MATIAERPNVVPWPPLLLVGAIGAGTGLRRLLPSAVLAGVAYRSGGIALSISALLLDASAVATLLRHRTSALPHRGSDALVTAGPYAISRNPIYLGNVLLTVGLALVFANPLLLAAAVVEAVLLERLAIVPEERHLETRFGDAWHDYLLRTPRWLRIPLRLCGPKRLGGYRTRT